MTDRINFLTASIARFDRNGAPAGVDADWAAARNAEKVAELARLTPSAAAIAEEARMGRAYRANRHNL